MSIFHETMREILEDVQRFLNCTLDGEHLSAASILHKESLLTKIQLLRSEYPQLHLQLVNEANGKALQSSADPSHPYTDMQGNAQTNNDYVISDAREEDYEICNAGIEEKRRSLYQDQSKSDINNELKSGYLEKKGKDRLGGLLNTVQRRWVVLKDGQLRFFGKQGDKRSSGDLSLIGYDARFATFLPKDETKKNACFELVGPGLKTYQFTASDQNEAKEWVEAIFNFKNGVEGYNYNVSIGSQGSSGDGVAPNRNSRNSKGEDWGEVYEMVDDDHQVPRLNSQSSYIEEDLYHDTCDGLADNEVSLPFQYRDYFMALWDCKSVAPDELTFKRGDVIKIMSKEFDRYSWWIGSLNGKVGLVPKKYLTEAYELS